MADEGFRATNRVFEDEVVGRGDFGALARVYTREARILPPGSGMVTGLPAITEFWRGAAASLGVTAVKLHTVTLEVQGDRAQEVGRGVLSLTKQDTPLELKYVVLWKREDGAWKWDVDIWNT